MHIHVTGGTKPLYHEFKFSADYAENVNFKVTKRVNFKFFFYFFGPYIFLCEFRYGGTKCLVHIDI